MYLTIKKVAKIATINSVIGIVAQIELPPKNFGKIKINAPLMSIPLKTDTINATFGRTIA